MSPRLISHATVDDKFDKKKTKTKTKPSMRIGVYQPAEHIYRGTTENAQPEGGCNGYPAGLRARA